MGEMDILIHKTLKTYINSTHTVCLHTCIYCIMKTKKAVLLLSDTPYNCFYIVICPHHVT